MSMFTFDWSKGHVVTDVTIRASAQELAALSDEQRSAFMGGLAKVIGAARQPLKQSGEQK